MTEQLSRRERKELRKQEQEEQREGRRRQAEAGQRNKRIINYAVIGLIALAAAYGIFRWVEAKNAPGEYDALAQCLTSKGAVMYGTDWCPHCQKQKSFFGNSFKYVNYINCDLSKPACDAAGVEGYPTWTFPKGESLSGEQALSTLAERAGCQIE